MIRRPLLPALAAALLLAACNPAEVVGDVQQLQQQSKQLSDSIRQHTGSQPQVGANRHNGKLVLITVVFDSSQLPTQTLPQLQTLLQAEVQKHFGEAAENIQISFVFPGQ